MLRTVFSIVTVLITILISGCVTTSGNSQGRVAMIDTSERAHLDNTLNMTDLMSLADKLTNDMLMSDTVLEWGNERPKLVIGHLINETDDDNIPEEMIYDRIRGLILQSGVARIVSENSNNFKYILHGVLNSTQEYSDDGSSMRQFRVTLNLSDIEGEQHGQWQGRISLGKAKRSLF